MNSLSTDNIMVSVLCTAYNHEKYIRECIEGFVNQKTSFRFEVIIHDDASTDETARIIREYELKYPELIKPIYQIENQFSKGVKIIADILFPLSEGKYIAVCEGDDYWIDTNKLQKQVEALEKNHNVNMCVCRVLGVSEDGKEKIRLFPEHDFKKRIIGKDDYFQSGFPRYPFQTSSYVFRRAALKTYIEERPEFVKISPVGDESYLLYFCHHGGILYVPDTMSCYRMNSTGSWSQQVGINEEKRISHHKGMMKMLEAFDSYSLYEYHSYCARRIWFHKLEIARIYDDPKLFRELIRKESKTIFEKTSIKTQLSVLSSAFVPKLLKFYRLLKEKAANGQF